MTAEKQSSLRSDLGRARGLGSAKDGTHHWWMQRVSAIAMIPPIFYFLYNIDHVVSSDYVGFVNWMTQPLPALAMLLFVVTSFYHAALGIQVIIEDYIHCEGKKFFFLLLNKLFFFFLSFATAYAVVRLNFGF